MREKRGESNSTHEPNKQHYLCLTSNYNQLPKMAVYCSRELKFFKYNIFDVVGIFSVLGAKIASFFSYFSTLL